MNFESTVKATPVVQTPFISKTEKSTWVVTSFVAASFFSYGTAMMDYFLVYPSRAIVGAQEFVAYHALLEERILPISVVPFALLTLLNLLLCWLRPRSVPRGLVWASLACLVLDWISTILFQIPMNLQLGSGKDPALIQHIMDTNWGRILLETAQAALAFGIMQKAVSPRRYAPGQTAPSAPAAVPETAKT